MRDDSGCVDLLTDDALAKIRQMMLWDEKETEPTKGERPEP